MMRAPSGLGLLGLVFAAALSVGCGREKIPYTDVEDTAEAREVIDFVEKYRIAVTERSVPKLLALAHPDYFDDMGTPQGDDDVDLDGLTDRLTSTFNEDLMSVHYDIKYRDVVFLPTKILVDYTYIGRFRINTPDGSRWERRLADNRMVLVKAGENNFKIASGM
jgi:hypothetical protein